MLRIIIGEPLALARDSPPGWSAKAGMLLLAGLSNSLLSIMLIGRFKGLVYRGLREIAG
jgi:hypothetical protein